MADERCHGAWQSLLPSGKLSGRPRDASRDVLKLDPDALTMGQRHLVQLIASRATDAATRARVARQMVSLHTDARLVAMLQRLTGSICGLPAEREYHFNNGETEPCAMVTFPLDGHARSGGPCPPHQDYEPHGKYGCTRSLSFYMLLQDTHPALGPTYVYAGSRKLACRERAEPAPKSVGRPKKRKRSPARARQKQALLHPQTLRRDLTSRCGEPILLTGREHTIFRHESAEWHGALPNMSDERRAVLIWTYCTKDLLGKFVRTVPENAA